MTETARCWCREMKTDNQVVPCDDRNHHVTADPLCHQHLRIPPIDRDIVEHVDEMQPSTLAQRVAIETTLQNRRDRGEKILGDHPLATTPSGTRRNEIIETPTQVRARLIEQLEIAQADVEEKQLVRDTARDVAKAALADLYCQQILLTKAKEERDKLTEMVTAALPSPEPDPDLRDQMQEYLR